MPLDAGDRYMPMISRQLVELPSDPALLRKVARLLEKAGEWSALASILGALSQCEPALPRTMVAEYDAWCRAGDPDQARRRLDRHVQVMLGRGPQAVAALRGSFRAAGLSSAIVNLEHSILERSPHDRTSRLRYLVALIEAGAIDQAVALVGDMMSASGCPTAFRRRIMEAFSESAESAWLTAAKEFALADPTGFITYLHTLEDDKQTIALVHLCDVAMHGGREIIRTQLTIAECLERSGHFEQADMAYASVESKLSTEESLNEAAPTSSTLLFRNQPLLGCLVECIRWYCALQAPVRVHIGACSTGEEVYSLALALEREGLLTQCALSASDVDSSLVARARGGVVDPRNANRMPTSYLARFQPQRDGGLRLAEEVLARIAFDTQDLLAPGSEAAYHVLLANNVLVHFPGAEASSMLLRLSERLTPDGLLCIGGSRHDRIAAALATARLMPIVAHADRVYESWRLQRHAWYIDPRPYWAIPPARSSGQETWRHTALFARSADVAAQLQRRLERLEAVQALEPG
jgi:chemotaxis methyl-accepting protein methylase